MSKLDNFKGKQNTNGLKENPDNINKTGVNRKSFASINNEMLAKGVEPLTKKQLVKAYELVLNATEEELLEIAEDKQTPYGLKLIIVELNKPKTRSKALQDYRNYMFGRADNNSIEPVDDKDTSTIIQFVGLDDNTENTEDNE